MSEINLQQKFPEMRPIKKPPALATINGCGVGVYGRRGADAETGTYVKTLCLSLVFVPLVALRAYRVAPASQGAWYFIGREPLSAFARVWNILIVAAIAGGIGLLQYRSYTSSPAYVAKQQMRSAAAMVAEGRLAQAATTYRGVAAGGTGNSAEAAAAVGALLDGECARAPLNEAAGVYQVAADLARRQQSPPAATVAGKGMKLVGERGDADPAGGVAVLDAVRPLVLDTREVDARRLALLRKWAEKEPANLDAVVPLASLLEEQGQLDDAKKLLLPVKANLGDAEGARVLGTILAREGDYEGAYGLLWPYVKSRLEGFHAAERSWRETLERLERREVELLEQNKGPRDFYAKYDAAGPDGKSAIVRDYLDGRIKDNPEYAAAQDAMRREARIVPVAMDLGIVMLQRAQGQADAPARTAQLQSAEQVFLAIRGVAGESDAYRLSLAQVYYWLGKHAEGRKLFDEYLASKGRAAEDLLQVANTLWQLGAVGEARTMAEESYDKGTKPAEKHAAAKLRSTMSKDNEDRMAWLGKSDTSSADVKAALAKGAGDKAQLEGRDAEAAQQYRQAIAAYELMPRSSSSLNETALACYSLFQVSGDQQTLDRCFDCFQQAVELEPQDTVLLFNAGVTLLEAALNDVVGDEIDLRALRATASLSMLSHLYHDQAGRDAIVGRVKGHPGIARGAAYLEKVTVLAPKSTSAFSSLFGLHRFTRDDAALAKLDERLRTAEVDTAGQLEGTKEYLSGAKDAQTVSHYKAALARGEELVSKVRPKGGRTAAVALEEQAELVLAMYLFDENTDLDRAVALADEAERLSPSASTSTAAATARLYRAVRDLRRSQPAFDQTYRTYARTLAPLYVLAHAAAAEPSEEFRKALAANADVQRALAKILDDEKRYAESTSGYEWALLTCVDPVAAERHAKRMREFPRKRVERSISAALSPWSAGDALETHWTALMLGEPDAARERLSRIAEAGIPVPLAR